MVGFSGLRPTVVALKAGKAIALANKETLVVAGEIITRLALENKCPLLPVDSEHSAIFQCLTGSGDNPVEALLLTASGGPFRQMDAAALARVTAAQALKHPNWVMGAKITIDSASMMNKGFEKLKIKFQDTKLSRLRKLHCLHYKRMKCRNHSNFKRSCSISKNQFCLLFRMKMR